MVVLLAAVWMAAEPVSFSRDVATMLALRCANCHGLRSMNPAAGLSVRTHADLVAGGEMGRAVIPGDPENSLLVQFIDGRRGPTQTMPQGAPPLERAQVELIRRWIAEGAKEDEDRTPRAKLRRSAIIEPGRVLRITARTPAECFLTMTLRGIDGGAVLRVEEAAVNGRIEWTLKPERGWPREVEAELVIAYAAGDATAAEFAISSERIR